MKLCFSVLSAVSSPDMLVVIRSAMAFPFSDVEVVTVTLPPTATLNVKKRDRRLTNVKRRKNSGAEEMKFPK